MNNTTRTYVMLQFMDTLGFMSPCTPRQNAMIGELLEQGMVMKDPAFKKQDVYRLRRRGRKELKMMRSAAQFSRWLKEGINGQV